MAKFDILTCRLTWLFVWTESLIVFETWFKLYLSYWHLRCRYWYILKLLFGVYWLTNESSQSHRKVCQQKFPWKQWHQKPLSLKFHFTTSFSQSTQILKLFHLKLFHAIISFHLKLFFSFFRGRTKWNSTKFFRSHLFSPSLSLPRYLFIHLHWLPQFLMSRKTLVKQRSRDCVVNCCGESSSSGRCCTSEFMHL